MRRLRAVIGDPFFTSVVMLVALVLGGLIALALAWRGAAGFALVADQIPYVISGGLGGVALVGFALGLLTIQSRRWAEARRRAEFDRVLRAAAELLAATRRDTGIRRP